MFAVRHFFIHNVWAKPCVHRAGVGCQCMTGTIGVDAWGGVYKVMGGAITQYHVSGCAGRTLLFVQWWTWYGSWCAFHKKPRSDPVEGGNAFEQDVFVIITAIQTTILYLCEKVGEGSGFMGSDRNTASSSRFASSACMALRDRVTSLSPLSLGGVQGTALVQRGRKDEWRKERSLLPKHTTNYKGRKTHTHLTN